MVGKSWEEIQEVATRLAWDITMGSERKRGRGRERERERERVHSRQINEDL